MARNCIGFDVSSRWIDVHHPDTGHARIGCEPKALRAFARLASREARLVVFEASGGCDRPLRTALEKAGAPLPPARRALQELQARRRQVVEMRKQEKARRASADRESRRFIDRHVTWLDADIARLDKRIVELVAADDELARDERRLRAAPGVGPVVAATLLAWMPELGRLDRRRIAALAGLAPVARDSGLRSPARSIAGGRPAARSMLYLAGLQASRRDPGLKAFRERLEARGRTPRQAIIAVARKLLTILSAMRRTGQDHAPQVVG